MARSASPGSLTGVVEATLDDKSRVVLPARFRRVLPTTITLWISPERCLMVGSPEAHDATVAALARSSSAYAATARRLARIYVDSVGVDGQGRMSVPAAMVRAARLSPGTPVLIEGHGGHVQIWDALARERLLEHVASDVVADQSGWGDLADELDAATLAVISTAASTDSAASHSSGKVGTEVSTD